MLPFKLLCMSRAVFLLQVLFAQYRDNTDDELVVQQLRETVSQALGSGDFNVGSKADASELLDGLLTRIHR